MSDKLVKRLGGWTLYVNDIGMFSMRDDCGGSITIDKDEPGEMEVIGKLLTAIARSKK